MSHPSDSAIARAVERNKYHVDRKMQEAVRLILSDARDIDAAAPEGAQTVAEVVQREPFLDGSPNPMKELRWSLRNCEDDLPVGTKLYTTPPQPQDAAAMVCLVTHRNLPHFAAAEIQLYGGYEPKVGDRLHLAPQGAARAPKSQADCPERYKGAYSFRHGWATGYNDAMIDATRSK